MTTDDEPNAQVGPPDVGQPDHVAIPESAPEREPVDPRSPAMTRRGRDTANEKAPPVQTPVTYRDSHWKLGAGIAFGLLGICSLIVIVVLTQITQRPIHADNRMPIVFIFALTAAFGAGFVGGEAAAKGKSHWNGPTARPSLLA